jgi:hypothetical protein
MRHLVQRLALVLMLSSSTLAMAGEPLNYAADETLGAAYSIVSIKGLQVSGTLAYCVERDPSLKARSAAVATAWENRNAKYVALGPVFRAELQEKARKAGADAQWREFDEQSMPAMKELGRTVLIQQMKNASDPQRKDMCERMLKLVASGKFDISEDLQLVDYLNRRVSEQASQKPGISKR